MNQTNKVVKDLYLRNNQEYKNYYTYYSNIS